MADRSPSQSQVAESVQARRDSYVELLRALLAVSAGGEEALQQEIGKRFEALGCRVESIASAPNRFLLPDDFGAPRAGDAAERVSVAAALPGAGGGRSLLVFAHPDSEPFDGAAGWTREPFAGAIADGKIYGWGIADDLSGVAAMLCALDALRGAGIEPGGDVVCVSAVSKRRAQGIFAVLERGYRADAALYLHPAESGAGFGDVKARSSGMLQFRVTTSGKAPDTSEPTHTPFAHLAVNAIDKAWLVYRALAQLAEDRARRVQHPAYAAIGRATNLQISHIEAGDGGRPGRIPTSAVMTGAVAFPPDESLADVQREIETAVSAVASGDPWLGENPPELEWLQGVSGVEVAEDSDIYREVASAIREATGRAPRVQSLHAGSEIRAPNLFAGIPTLGFGPLAGGNTQSGGVDEWVSIDDFMNMVEVVARIIVGYCG